MNPWVFVIGAMLVLLVWSIIPSNSETKDDMRDLVALFVIFVLLVAPLWVIALIRWLFFQ